MEKGTKKVVAIVTVVVCLFAAGLITILTRSSGGGGSSGNNKMWVKCNNPQCSHEYEMDREEYAQIAYKNGPRYAMMYGVPPIKCEKCGEESVFAATKCEKCGKVFFPGTVEGKYEDKCPACGYSPTEEAEK